MQNRWYLLATLGLWAGCSKGDQGAAQASARRAQEHADRGRQDIENLARGLTEAVAHAAPLLAAPMATPGNVARVRNELRALHDDATPIGREMRFVPAFFLAAVGTDGKAVAGDREPDRDYLPGRDLGAALPCVREALSGRAANCVAEFVTVEGQAPRMFFVSAQPLNTGDAGRSIGALVGAITLGTFAKSVRIDLDARSTRERVQLSVGVLHGARLYPSGADNDVVARYLVPPPLAGQMPRDAAQRMARGNGRFTFTFTENDGQQPWGAALSQITALGGDISVVVFRTELR